ncbi:MAG: glucose-1-phosphate cytidylyltransferase [Lachnospiraceae bacterium]|nr:glucose-1-phosphate cytidylyltransferase [Lachnospiraceae bacterium]
MKVIILVGGLPSTISDVKSGIPKPMAEIGGRPLIWHIMKLYAHYGFRDFIVCGGYKVNIIKEYFKDFYIYQSDITVDLASNEITIHNKRTEDWKVTVVDTGVEATTSERILQVKEFIGDEDFFVAYGDCLSDINFDEMLRLHKERNSFITMAVAKPTGRHSVLSIREDDVLMSKYGDKINEHAGDFSASSNALQCGEKRLNQDVAWVNASCYIFSHKALESLSGEELNETFMEKMAEKEKVHIYRHEGFWRPVETMRDSVALEEMWEETKAPWKVWEK